MYLFVIYFYGLIAEPVAPHIEEFEDLEVRYGVPSRLKAKISGFPIPEVKW